MQCKYVNGGRYGGHGIPIEEGAIAKFLVTNGATVVLIYAADGTIIERDLEQVRWCPKQQ